MKYLWDVLLQIKHWILGGAGASIILGIFIRNKWKKTKQTQKSGKNSINIQAGNDVNINQNSGEEKDDR